MGSSPQEPQRVDVLIGGAGFAGLALAIALRQGLGPSFSVAVADPALARDPEKACPGLDPGWEPVFGKDHAQNNKSPHISRQPGCEAGKHNYQPEQRHKRHGERRHAAEHRRDR